MHHRHGDEGNDGLECSIRAKIQACHEMSTLKHTHAQFLPVAGVPPVRVEMAISEARDLGEGTQQILKDD